jgi:pyruvate formate lyase activating enzyme
VGGRLKPVLYSIAAVYGTGFWLEVVTLIVPDFNDSPQELSALAGFLAGISPDIPWHVTAFHKSYKMTGPENTGAAALQRAASIGHDAGLRYVYAGNLDGRAGDLENTRCPGCHALVIERRRHLVLQHRLTAEGSCPECGSRIPGLWRTCPVPGKPLWVSV